MAIEYPAWDGRSWVVFVDYSVVLNQAASTVDSAPGAVSPM